MGMKFWLSSTLFLLAQPMTSADGLDLTEAVQRALDHNPLLQAGIAGRETAAAGLRQAKSGRLPSLDFTGTYTHSNNPVFVFGSLLEQGRFSANNFDPAYLNNPGALSNFRSSLDLRIPIFNRFQVSSDIEKAEIREGQAEADEDWLAQQLRFKVVQTYFGVLVAEARKEVAAEAVRLAESEVKRIRDRFDQGMVVESDLLAMEVQLAEFRQQLVQAGGEENTARAALNTILAQPIGTRENLKGQLEDRAFTVPPESELVWRALENRPDYRRSEMEVQLIRQDLKTTKGQYWPDLNIFGQLGHSTQTFANGSGDFAVGARLTFKLLNFGREAHIDQVSAASEAARAQERHKANEVQFEVVKAYQSFVTSQEKVLVAKSAVNQAEETLRIVNDRHGVGLTTITEVLRSQTALLRARLNLLAARYDYYVGYAQTLLVTGQLTDVGKLTT
jgi:outer membrane protein TolC